MRHLEKHRLGELVEILSGFAFDSEKFGDSGEMPIVRIRDVVPGRSSTFYNGEYDQKYLLRDGDMLIGMDGEFNLAKWQGGPAVLNQRVCRIAAANGILDDGYLYRFLPAALKAIEDVTPYVTVKHLSVKTIRDIEIPLPPLAEQRRIAEVLDRAEALRAKRRAALAQLDSLTQSLFLDLFGDPVFNPKRIPKRPLGEMIRVKSGDSVLVSELSDSGEYPVYGGNGINGYHTRFMFESPLIVIGRVGVYCGVVHITKPKAWVTDNALFVTGISPELDVPYLAQALTIANLNQYAGRAAQPLVSGSRIYPVEILVPPIPLQREFARRVTAVEALKTAQRASLAELDALFATLQHRAFKGEL